MSTQVRVRTVLNGDGSIGVKVQGPAEFGELPEDAPESGFDAASLAALVQELEDAEALFVQTIAPKLQLLKVYRQNNSNAAVLASVSRKAVLFNTDPTTFGITFG